MAKKSAPLSMQALVQQVSQQLAVLVGAEVRRRLEQTRAATRVVSSGKAPTGRMCPVPGCGQPGKGPRNRYFCSEHARALSVEEQR